MTDGADEGEGGQMIIMLAGKTYIMFIVEDVMTYTTRTEMWLCACAQRCVYVVW